MRNYLVRIYNKVLHISSTKWAVYALAFVAFTESSIFLIPPDCLLIPMAIAKPKRAFFYAFIVSVFSVLGGLLGYLLGYFFYEYIGVIIIKYFHYEQSFNHIKELYEKYGALAIFVGGFTPIPYKLFTLFSGFIKANLTTFIIASVLSRFMRFFLVALIIYFLGDKAKVIIEKHIGKITIISTIFIVVFIYLIIKS